MGGSITGKQFTNQQIIDELILCSFLILFFFLLAENITVESVIRIKPLIYHLIRNLDRFYRLSSYWLLTKQIVTIISIIFSFVYFTLPVIDDSMNMMKNLLIFDLIRNFILEFIYFHITGHLTEIYEKFFNILIQFCVLKPKSILIDNNEQQSIDLSSTIYATILEQPPSSSTFVNESKIDHDYCLDPIRIELFQLKYYKEKTIPKIFSFIQLQRSIHFKCLVFCINFAVILLQTEQTNYQ